jgi:hypothetical protein
MKTLENLDLPSYELYQREKYLCFIIWIRLQVVKNYNTFAVKI